MASARRIERPGSAERADQLLDFFGRQRLGQRGQLPVGGVGHRTDQPVYEIAERGAVAEVAAQRRHHRTGACRLAVELGLLREEAADVLGLDRGDVDGAVAEARRPATARRCAVPCSGSSAPGRARAPCTRRSGAVPHPPASCSPPAGRSRPEHAAPPADGPARRSDRADHAEPVRRNGSEEGARRGTRRRTLRRCVADADAAPVNPLREVGDAAHVVGERVRGVAAIGQVLLERINVRRRDGPSSSQSMCS